MLKRILFSGAVVTLLVLPRPILANGNLDLVKEKFNHSIGVVDQSEPWDYWYETLISADAQGFYKQENLDQDLECNNAVCITTEKDGSDHFARLALNPQEFPGNVNIAQLSEQRDAFSYDAPHRWFPTTDNPVTMETRMRFSPNFHADGTGGAIGTTIVELWNAPDYYTDPTADISRDNSGFRTHFENTFVMGFTWTDPATLGGLFKGFKATVSDKTGLPSASYDLSGVNINDWFTGKIVWSVDNVGVQTISFYIDDVLVGSTVPAIPMPPLTVNVIQDNAQVTFGPGGIVYVRANPTESQYLDLDYISIKQ